MSNRNGWRYDDDGPPLWRRALWIMHDAAPYALLLAVWVLAYYSYSNIRDYDIGNPPPMDYDPSRRGWTQ